MKRRLVLLSAMASTLALAAAPGAETFPAKPVTIVVPFAAGGPSDIYARLLGRHLGQAWGQPVIVDNRAGATGTLGSAQVARARADGYTLLMASASSHIAPYLYTKVPYDPDKDFVPVIGVAAMPLYLVASPSFPANTFAELVSEVKRHPGRYAYASAGNGAANHLAMEQLKVLAGLDVLHVPYKGAAPAMQAVMSGEVAFTFDTISQADAQVRSGKLKAIAVTGARRVAAAPNVPTVAESGLPAFTPEIWFGAFAPAGTPASVVDKLNADISQAMTQPDVQARLASLGSEFTATSAAEFQKFVASDTARWRRVISQSGAKAD